MAPDCLLIDKPDIISVVFKTIKYGFLKRAKPRNQKSDLFFFRVLIELKTSCVLGKCLAAELHPQP